MARDKRHKKLQLDKFECILLLIIGLLLGTVFTFGVGYWNAVIAPEDALSVTATYERYDIDYGFGRSSAARHSINEVDLHFTDHEKLSIDGSCVTDELLAALDALRSGTSLNMLIHPNGDAILSIHANDEPILAFEDAMKHLSFERWGFFALGLFCYIGAGIGAYYLIARKYY